MANPLAVGFSVFSPEWNHLPRGLSSLLVPMCTVLSVHFKTIVVLTWFSFSETFGTMNRYFSVVAPKRVPEDIPTPRPASIQKPRESPSGPGRAAEAQVCCLFHSNWLVCFVDLSISHIHVFACLIKIIWWLRDVLSELLYVCHHLQTSIIHQLFRWSPQRNSGKWRLRADFTKRTIPRMSRNYFRCIRSCSWLIRKRRTSLY